ncbi:cell division inhibitor SepF [Mumia flava]|uniref:Cell division protein SepF n=1 Tax=Mumia flava TaxID=1348852 RepID=A0A0B2BQA0_9ACTN|nr:cell division protein SepF [Mumia flava]PJJ56018.1 cell division inhibitor SepF [Mumia flava]
MAGAMRKMGEYLGLVEQVDEFDDYDDDYAEQDSSRRSARPAPRESEVRTVARLDERRRPTPVPAPVAEFSRIVTLHPRTYNEARTIGEQFREGIPVIMNLTEMDDDDAKRLVDFAAGLIFAVHGTIERVTNKVFLLSPPNVTVTAEDRQRLVQGGFFNQS